MGHDRDDARDHRRAQPGEDARRSRPGAPTPELGRLDGRRIPARHDARRPPQDAPPGITGGRGQRRRARRRRHLAADAQAAGAEDDDAAVGHDRAPTDRPTVDAARHATGELQELDGPVGGDIEQGVVGLERAVVDHDGGTRRTADDVSPGDQRRHRPGSRAAFADHGHDRERRRPQAGRRRRRPCCRDAVRRSTAAHGARRGARRRWIGSRGSRPRASASAPSGSSPEAGATVTRRPDGSSISRLGTARVAMPPWVSRRAGMGNGCRRIIRDQGL